MTYFLDTSVIIDFLKKKEYIVDFIANTKNDYFSTSSICEAEVYAGVFRLKGEDREKYRGKVEKAFLAFNEIIPLDRDQAQIFGQLKAELAEKGQLIEDMDILIAAAALSRSAVLLTGNPRHFGRIKNLQIKSI